MAARRLHDELIIGIAERFKLAPQEIGIIAGHKGLRQSLDNISATEIGVLADIFSLNEQGEMINERSAREWFPVSELAFLPFGLGFRSVGEVEVERSGSRRRLANFRPTRALDVEEVSNLSFETAVSHRRFEVDAARTSRLRVQLDRKPAIAIAGAELARFYLASLGLVAQQLFRADYDFERAVSNLVNVEQTGWVDEVAKVYQIAPVPQLADNGGALELALILASDDLTKFWEDLAGNGRQSAMSGGEGLLDAPAPSCTKIIIANTYSYKMPFEGRWIPTLRVTRILSDLRPCPFDTLIIHIPTQPVPGNEPGNDTPSDGPPRLQWADTLKLNRNESPGRRHVKLAALGEQIFACFPALAKVEVLRKPAKQIPIALGKSNPGEQIDEVSTLPPIEGSNIGQLNSQRDNSNTKRRPPAPKGLLGRLFDDPPSEPLVRCSVGRSELSYPLNLCASALDLVGTSSLRNANAQTEELYELAAAWGPFARLSKGRTRRALVDWLRIEQKSVCVIELERRSHNDWLALGLFTRTDGFALSLQDAAAILRYACTRAERHEGLIWRTWPPNGAFEDLRSISLRHSSRYSTPKKLGDAIARGACALLIGSADAPIIASVPAIQEL